MNRDLQLWIGNVRYVRKQMVHHPDIRSGFTPMDIVAADILSGLPVTEDGLRYILVLTDYFAKWACAFALPDAEASTCMRIMYDGFFAQFGLPNQLHTDQGGNCPNCSISCAS